MSKSNAFWPKRNPVGSQLHRELEFAFGHQFERRPGVVAELMLCTIAQLLSEHAKDEAHRQQLCDEACERLNSHMNAGSVRVLGP